MPVEAMAYGCPVLAYRSGGAVETISDMVGGLFFDTQSVDSIEEGMSRMKLHSWNPVTISSSIAHFNRNRFEQEFMQWVNG